MSGGRASGNWGLAMTHGNGFKLIISWFAIVALMLLPACHKSHEGSASDCKGQAWEASTSAPAATEPVTIAHSTQPQVVPNSPNVGDVKPVEPKKVDTIPAVANVESSPARKAIRIKAGAAATWKDKDGNEWLADAGFTDGAMVDLGKVKIEGTANPDLYSSEHSNMEKFSWPVANGKYAVTLHFVESPDDVKKAGDRVFSIDVLGEKIKGLDILKEAGGFNKALVKTVHITVTGGKIEISFKAEQKEPQINGIEILPE